MDICDSYSSHLTRDSYTARTFSSLQLDLALADNTTMAAEGARNCIIAMDGSEHADYALDCE